MIRNVSAAREGRDRPQGADAARKGIGMRTFIDMLGRALDAPSWDDLNRWPRVTKQPRVTDALEASPGRSLERRWFGLGLLTIALAVAVSSASQAADNEIRIGNTI